MKTLTTIVSVFLWGLVMFNCTNEALNPRTCGEGTQEIDGVCQSLIQCGTATERVGDVCQFAPSVLCGSGTILEGNECVRENPARTCGEDVIEQSGECIREYPLVTCGAGTIEVAGECLVEDPLSCGEGTTVEGTVCTHQPCGEGTVLGSDGLTCISEEFISPPNFRALCPQIARSMCDSFVQCGCAASEEAPLMTQLLYEVPELCEVATRINCADVIALLALYDATGHFTANTEVNSQFVDLYRADGSCNAVMNDLIGGPGGGVQIDDFLLAALDSGDPCLPGDFFATRACIEEDQVCRPDPNSDEEGALYCLGRQGLYEECRNHAECLDSLFCNGEGDPEPNCRARPGLGQTCDPSSMPCGQSNCCSDLVCVDLPGEDDPCCGNLTCGESDTLFCNTWGGANLCTAYAGEGESCDSGVKCDRGLRCHPSLEGEETQLCYSAVPYCEAFYF